MYRNLCTLLYNMEKIPAKDWTEDQIQKALEVKRLLGEGKIKGTQK